MTAYTVQIDLSRQPMKVALVPYHRNLTPEENVTMRGPVSLALRPQRACLVSQNDIRNQKNKQSADMVTSAAAVLEVSAYTSLPTVALDKDPVQS